MLRQEKIKLAVAELREQNIQVILDEIAMILGSGTSVLSEESLNKLKKATTNLAYLEQPDEITWTLFDQEEVEAQMATAFNQKRWDDAHASVEEKILRDAQTNAEIAWYEASQEKIPSRNKMLLYKLSQKKIVIKK